MKFTQTDYSGIAEILKFPDHYVALAVMVDDSGVSANDDGKKIVPKGTVVGGLAASVLADDTQTVSKKNTASVAASLTTELTGENNDITFTANEAGTGGNAIKVELLDPSGNSQALSVSVSGDTIVVSLATSGEGAITSTAAEVIAAINAHLVAKELVTAENAAENTGVGVVTALAATALSGGTAGSALGAEGVLMNDVDVTYGDAPGAMIIHGYIAIDKLPEEPVAEAVAALKQIVFIK